MVMDHLYAASLRTKAGTKWGYINEVGEFEIQPDYDFALDFQKNGLATVEKNGKYGCIDVLGNTRIPFIFESMIEFSEGRAAVVYKGGFHVINEQGNILTQKPYNFIGAYQDGRALVSDQEAAGHTRYGYLDLHGNEVIPIHFEAGSDFSDGLAIVKLTDLKFALIDRLGNAVNLYPYFFVGNYGENMLAFQKEPSALLGYIDLRGNLVIYPSYKSAQAFEDSRAVVTGTEDFKSRYGLIDRTGKYIISPMYNDIMPLGEHRIAIGKEIDRDKPYLGSSYALGNWKGEFLTDFRFDHVSRFEQGIASVSDGKSAYFIDRTGNRARGLPIIKGGESVTLVGKLVRAMKGTRVAYFDRKGNLVWKQNTIIPLTSRYRVLEKLSEPNKDYLVYYPQVDGIKNEKAQITVNKRLKELSKVREDIDPSAQLDYSYVGDFNVSFYQNNLLVIELYGYEYYFGAAHGMPFKIYVHINLISGRMYALEDLFKKDSDYISRLNNIIEDMIKTDPQYDYVFPGSFQGIVEDQPFYVDQDHLYVFFAPYEIGPYAAGFPIFKISFTKVQDIIDEKGEFWLSFH